MAEIVGIVGSFLGPVIELGKCIVAPIKRQFNYLCCFNSNINSLRDEAKRLDDVREGLQMKVDRAKNNVEVILPEVETWLGNANAIKASLSRIEGEISKVQSGNRLAIKARFSLSKKVKKTTEDMKELRDQCKFSIISQPAAPAAMELVSLGTTYEFESRKGIEEEIMTSLRAKNVNMIGICGMGGVGKTTMAKRIMNRAMGEHLFDEVVMVVISQHVEKLRIQREIAESLSLKFEEGTLYARAQKLRARLRGTKRILLVLDDVWKSFPLEDLGIPCESGPERCTILFTSRNVDVLSAMNVQDIYELGILSEGEAWFLFREKVGTCVDDIRLRSIAEKVTKECKGLPIALVIVARVLKDENSIAIWKDALQQLKRADPEDIPDVIAEVYNPLKLSYDFLPSEHAKSLFLICCLFREDDNIPLEYLSLFAMGLHMFDGIRNLEEVRNRTSTLIKMLKKRFLLLDGRDEYHVQMHDIVRDVSIFIASKNRRINCNDCTWISSFVDGRAELSVESGFPNLHLLFVNNEVEEEFQINDSFIERTRELNVLFILYDSLRSLPHTTQLLKNLQALFLYGCESLETISILGELRNLEILICRDCGSIEELPLQIGSLNRLRLLEFSNCRRLKAVAPGVISGLVGLEELKMVNSFDKWEADDEGKERKNAGLRELESLSNLTSLEIQVADVHLATEQICLPKQVVKFDITFGTIHSPPSKAFDKKLHLQLRRRISLISTQFLRSTEYLASTGNGSNNLDLGQAKNMRWLTLAECSTMKNITSSIDWTSGDTVFPLLESLCLQYLYNLEEIFDIDGPIPSNSFKNLKELRLEWLPALKQLCKSPYQNNLVSLFGNLSSIYIYKCDSLRNLLSLSTETKDCLSQLESLQIWHCYMMEQVVFLWNDEGNQMDIGAKNHHMTFPKLKRLSLWNLPNLTTFCEGIERIEFPLLTEMEITECPNLKSLVSTTCLTESGNNENTSGGISHDHDTYDDSFHLFCNPEKVSFDNLKLLTIGSTNCKNAWCHQIPIAFFTRLEELRIHDCGNFRSLFSSSIAKILVHLKQLNVVNCDEMVKVIEDDKEEKVASGGTTCLFPGLQCIGLVGLPKLEIFCQWKCDLELPSLKEVGIGGCPNMKSFTLGSLTTPKLETIGIDNKYATNTTKDLNDLLQRHFLKAKEELSSGKVKKVLEDQKNGEAEEQRKIYS